MVLRVGRHRQVVVSTAAVSLLIRYVRLRRKCQPIPPACRNANARRIARFRDAAAPLALPKQLAVRSCGACVVPAVKSSVDRRPESFHPVRRLGARLLISVLPDPAVARAEAHDRHSPRSFCNRPSARRLGAEELFADAVESSVAVHPAAWSWMPSPSVSQKSAVSRLRALKLGAGDLATGPSAVAAWEAEVVLALYC